MKWSVYVWLRVAQNYDFLFNIISLMKKDGLLLPVYDTKKILLKVRLRY